VSSDTQLITDLRVAHTSHIGFYDTLLDVEHRLKSYREMIADLKGHLDAICAWEEWVFTDEDQAHGKVLADEYKSALNQYRAYG
jgi:ABC-type nitrate/sulfonate/bicarbonate transport system substrate-binding protein